MAVCCQNLPLGELSSRSAPSVLVGELFKKFGLTTMAQAGLIKVIVLMRLYIFFNILIFNTSKIRCTEPYINGQGTEKIQSCP